MSVTSVGRSVRNILLFLRFQVVFALPLHHYPRSADRNRNVVESAKAVIVVRFGQEAFLAQIQDFSSENHHHRVIEPHLELGV